MFRLMVTVMENAVMEAISTSVNHSRKRKAITGNFQWEFSLKINGIKSKIFIGLLLTSYCLRFFIVLG